MSTSQFFTKARILLCFFALSLLIMSSSCSRGSGCPGEDYGKAQASGKTKTSSKKGTTNLFDKKTRSKMSASK